MLITELLNHAMEEHYGKNYENLIKKDVNEKTKPHSFTQK